VVLYETQFKGTNYKLGTSGFLYRSNKVMYDDNTTSLWSTLHGEPVSGPLVGKGIKLNRRSVVTTTWGEWKKRHPETTVLSLKTGHQRDYGEGVAYQSYFATDKVMFNVPKLDERLPNKREVVARLYNLQVGSDKVLIVTTPKGESRVYKTDGHSFKNWDGWNTLEDTEGKSWTLSEQELKLTSDGESKSFLRYPSHQSFWFGWNAQFPKARLIKE